MEDRKGNKSFKSSYTKGQRVVAGIGVGFLVLLYLVTLVAALTTSETAPELFRMCIMSTIFLPIVFWLYIRISSYYIDKGRKDMKNFMEQGQREKKKEKDR